MAEDVLGTPGTKARMNVSFPPLHFAKSGPYIVADAKGPLHLNIVYKDRVWPHIADQPVSPALTRVMRETLWRVDERAFLAVGKAGNYIRLIIPARYVIHGQNVAILGPIQSQVEVGLASGSIGVGNLIWPEVKVNKANNLFVCEPCEVHGEIVF